jgi:AraC-like DNA-binding protein
MGSAERPTDDGPGSPHEFSLRSRDPVEASAAAARVYHEHRLTILGDHDAFTMSLDAASLGPITLGWLSFDTEIRVDAEPHADAYQVNLMSAGQTRAYCGSDQMIATSTRGMIFRPDRPTGFVGWRTPGQMLAIKIERHALEDEMRQLLHRPVTGPIAFELALDLSRRAAADWNELVCTLATGLFDPGSLFRQPIMTVPLVHAILSGLLLSADHDLRAQLDAPARSIGPTSVRRADEYIEQHAHEPLTVAQVASSAGVSIRALQQGFKRSLGATPYQIIQQTRLERAHHDLVNASTNDATVASIGAKWGFPHAGRFAALYHARYNTYPSTTLRCAGIVRDRQAAEDPGAGTVVGPVLKMPAAAS